MNRKRSADLATCCRAVKDCDPKILGRIEGHKRIFFFRVLPGKLGARLGRGGDCLLVVGNVATHPFDDVAPPAPSTPGSHRPGDARPACARRIWNLHFRASSSGTPGPPLGGFAAKQLRQPRGERQGKRSRMRCSARRGEASVGWALGAPRRQDRHGSKQDGLGQRGG